MFRFTIRDVLWLTVVVAMGVAWLVDRSGLARNLQEELRAEQSKPRMLYVGSASRPLLPGEKMLVSVKLDGSVIFDPVPPSEPNP